MIYCMPCPLFLFENCEGWWSSNLSGWISGGDVPTTTSKNYILLMNLIEVLQKTLWYFQYFIVVLVVVVKLRCFDGGLRDGTIPCRYGKAQMTWIFSGCQALTRRRGDESSRKFRSSWHHHVWELGLHDLVSWLETNFSIIFVICNDVFCVCIQYTKVLFVSLVMIFCIIS